MTFGTRYGPRTQESSFPADCACFLRAPIALSPGVLTEPLRPHTAHRAVTTCANQAAQTVKSAAPSLRLPVFGFPVEGAPSSIRQAGFLGVVFGNFETVRNQLNPVQETGGRLPVETPALYDALVRSYECLKIGQYGRQLSKPIFGAGFLRNQGSQDYRVWVPLGRFELLYRMALCLAL
ncbi:hypothetical protein ACJJTC_005695 [Scirpophaga incertulas]